MAIRPFPLLASVAFPVAYILSLPLFSSVRVGNVLQPVPDSSDWCLHTVTVATARDVLARNHPSFPDYYSISGFISSSAAGGVFATLCAPGLTMLWTHPVVTPTPLSTSTLLVFYVAWTCFLGTPYLANRERHDVFVATMFTSLIAHFTVQYVGIRREGMTDTPMLVAYSLLFLSCVAIVLLTVLTPNVPIYWIELVAIGAILSFTPLHAWRWKAIG
jgi:hypothetical protein